MLHPRRTAKSEAASTFAAVVDAYNHDQRWIGHPREIHDEMERALLRREVIRQARRRVKR